MKLASIVALAGFIQTVSSTSQIKNALGQDSYGVDVSFPVHYLKFVDGPLGHKQKMYDDFMAGCRAQYSNSPQACDITEEDRVAMSVRQPASMQVRTVLALVPYIYICQ